ncbi:hypothetical protein D9M71_587650 [compost metagenome]
MVTSLARLLVLAAVMVHARHHFHAHGLHWARFSRRIDARHPVKRKRHDKHQDGEQSNEAFHDGRI